MPGELIPACVGSLPVSALKTVRKASGGKPLPSIRLTLCAADQVSVTASPLQRLRWIGGSGQPVGIAASPNASTNSGGSSLQLPTNRIFRDGLED